MKKFNYSYLSNESQRGPFIRLVITHTYRRRDFFFDIIIFSRALWHVVTLRAQLIAILFWIKKMCMQVM